MSKKAVIIGQVTFVGGAHAGETHPVWTSQTERKCNVCGITHLATLEYFRAEFNNRRQRAYLSKTCKKCTYPSRSVRIYLANYRTYIEWGEAQGWRCYFGGEQLKPNSSDLVAHHPEGREDGDRTGLTGKGVRAGMSNKKYKRALYKTVLTCKKHHHEFHRAERGEPRRWYDRAHTLIEEGLSNSEIVRRLNQEGFLN